MRLASFTTTDGPRLGIVTTEAGGDVVRDVTEPLSAVGAARMEEVVDLDGPALGVLSGLLDSDLGSMPAMPVSAVTLLPPVTAPGQMLFVRSNYPAPDGSVPQLRRPAFFSKVPSSLIGHRGTVLLPDASNQVDWEAELAFVIGRPASHVPEGDVFDYIAGYTINNDITARDLQAEGEPALAKNFRTFSPLGPWLVTADEITDPGRLGIKQWVNDELYQDGNTADMLYGIPEIIAYLTTVTDLRPGDVIATGSPSGLGRQQDPPVYLQEGDTMTIEVEGIGTLVNDVARGP